MRLGFHVSVARGLAFAARHAHEIGCECLQVFVRNARGWRARAYREREVTHFLELLTQRDLRPLIVHSCYLVNLASPAPALLEKSRRAVTDDLQRAARLGGRAVSVHTGNHMGAGLEVGLRILAESIRLLLGTAPPGVDLLLENSAGAGRQLGGAWDHYARVLDLLGGEPRLGITFDTCHAHAAGHRLDHPRAIARTLRDFDRALGLERMRLIHLNDSRGPAGSHLDRHQHIGRGTIGDRGFRGFLRRRELQHLCAILETPMERPHDDARNIAHTRKLISGGSHPLPPAPASPRRPASPASAPSVDCPAPATGARPGCAESLP
jgi:deoxyribonuclease-4